MTVYQALGIGSALFLGAFIVAIFALNRIGRDLVRRLERQQPDLYEECGRPVPTLLPSPARAKYDEFIMQRRYELILDGELARRFARMRKLEFRLLALATLALISLASALLRL
ncbi:MAG: hypothetical protein OEM23_02260 [Gemmatimonadota bacterium]|nr:hypothetical protein [Gemmatimonadota bacterium]MDH3427233.1 hypothetical protein [Gemmatimonadota bacterium]